MTHDVFHTPKSAARNYRNDHRNTGQMCTVNYSGRPRMCDLKCPNWKKMCRRHGLLQKKIGKHTAYQEITFFCFLQ